MKDNKKSVITSKKVFFSAACAFVLMLCLRFYQIAAITDLSTGFFTNRSNKTVPFFFFLLAVIVIGSFIACLLCGDLPGQPLNNGRSLIHGIPSLLLSLPLIAEGWSDIASFLASCKSLGGFNFAVEAAGGILFTVAPFAMLLAGITFFLNAVSLISGKMFMKKLKLLQLTPSLWAFSVTIKYFSVTASYLRIPQFMMTIFASAFLMLFLFGYARFVSNVGFAKASRVFFANGIISATLLLVTSVTNIVRIGSDAELASGFAFEPVYLLAGLFVVSAMYFVCREDSVSALVEENVESATAGEAISEGDNSAENEASDSDNSSDVE